MLTAIATFVAIAFRAWLGRRRTGQHEGPKSEMAIDWKIDTNRGASTSGRWSRTDSATADADTRSIE
ncbi:hypothetical protein [Kitasatospora sp. NPDC050463]|uniref:hypothetical protein n=1 Tax=Kitasatospora sp. NPDC050463 TaxID=3155786 RepID=UPI0033DE4E72